MSRSNYTDDYQEQWQWIMWRGAVTAAIKGKRGQAALRELLVALDAMPVKELIKNSLGDGAGQYCTLGVLGHARGLDERMAETDADEPCEVSGLLNLSQAFVREVAYENDEGGFIRATETGAERWTRMRQWVASQIVGA